MKNVHSKTNQFIKILTTKNATEITLKNSFRKQNTGKTFYKKGKEQRQI